MNAQTMQYSNKLQMLYSSKLAQLLRAQATPQTLRYQVLKAEAEAIYQQLKQLGLTKVDHGGLLQAVS